MVAKILVVDDEKDVCEALKETLEYEGHEVRTTGSGEEALRWLKESVYDILLVDMRLEGSVSGVDVIKSYELLRGQTKILAISATPPDMLKPIFEKEGIAPMIERVLEKPVDVHPEKITAIIKEVLETKEREANDE